MKKLFNFIHAKLGDLWWYSLLIFLASRVGDAIQAFIGLWLVPKYLDPSELGAVVPLQQLCSLFSIPLMTLAIVFMKYVNIYAARGERGKVKALIRDTLLATLAIFAFCIVAAIIFMPLFYERLKIASGLLTVLVLATGFSSALSQIFSNALQGLKKFATLTITHLISAPIRLITLLFAMPIRPLSGYILAQATPAASCSCVAALSLYRDFKNVEADYSWRRDLKKIARMFFPLLFYHLAMSLYQSLYMTIYRQRLPEIESAAYYILSRFAEIATYAGLAIATVIFPLASEAYEQGKNSIGILKKSIATIATSTILLAILFYFIATPLLSITEVWKVYREFATLLPAMTVSSGLFILFGIVVNYELACRRCKFLIFNFIANTLWIAFLLAMTGYEYFRGLLPDVAIDFIASCNFATLSNITYANLISLAMQLPVLTFLLRRDK